MKTMATASALLMALSSGAHAQWTTLNLPNSTAVTGLTLSHLDDGRYVYGNGNDFFVQDNFGITGQTQHATTNPGFGFPSFLDVRSDNTAVTGNGFSSIHSFDAGNTASGSITTNSTSFQDYAAVLRDDNDTSTSLEAMALGATTPLPSLTSPQEQAVFSSITFLLLVQAWTSTTAGTSTSPVTMEQPKAKFACLAPYNSVEVPLTSPTALSSMILEEAAMLVALRWIARAVYSPVASPPMVFRPMTPTLMRVGGSPQDLTVTTMP